MPKVAEAILMFTPERWGEVSKFGKFYSGTFEFDERAQRSISGVESHIQKHLTLVSLAKKLEPNLEADRAQLEEQGFTPAANAHEVAAVIEAAILELYSSIDCTVRVLAAVYNKDSRGFKNSTRSLFQNIENVSGLFPPGLKATIAGASWYWDLLHLRDELTHLGTGSVHAHENTKSLKYFNFGMKKAGEAFVVDDLFEWLDNMFEEVNRFLGEVFRHLNGRLKDEPVFQICGMVKGRALHRYVSPAGELTFDSGQCGAWIWFDQPENPTCPFKQQCGAYKNKTEETG